MRNATCGNKLAACAAGLLGLYGTGAWASTITLPPVSIGAGIRTSFTNIDTDGGGRETNDFEVNNVRLYLGGSVTEWLKLTFNTEYSGSYSDDSNDVQVMDAIAQFEFAPEMNIWAGRFLPPSDRANLYGPFYANHWGVYTDAVQDNWPDVAVGRDNGVAYWGDFLDKKLKLSAGLFDVPETAGGAETTDKVNGGDVIFATRVQYDFWDAEPGYWLNSTYYGEKNLLAIGAAYQTVDSEDHFSVDFLMEKNAKSAGVFTVEAEYDNADGMSFGGFGDAVDSDGWYALLSWLTPQPIGYGKIQVLGKYAESTNNAVDGDPKLKTTEVDVGYIIKTFNARVYLFVIDSNPDGSKNSTTSSGVGLQIQI